MTNFSPRVYADMALYLMDDIDLGSASQAELDALAIAAIAEGFGFVVSGVGE